MAEHSSETQMTFDSVEEAFKHFIENVYKDIPPEIKAKNNLHYVKRDYTKRKVSTKRMERILEEIVGMKRIFTQKF